MTEVLAAPQTDLSDYQSWLHEMPNGDAYMIDPITREPLDTTKPPALLLQDERLRIGYDFLQAHGSSIDLTLFQSLHAEAQHLDTATRPSFEQHVMRSDMLFVEGIGWDRPYFKRAVNAFRLGAPCEGNSFEERWLTAAVNSRVLLTSADVEATQHVVDKIILRMWANYNTQFNQGKSYQSAFLVTQYLREWYMPGKLGYEMATKAFNGWFGADLEQQDIPHLNILKTIGIGHLALKDKFEACNTTPSVVYAKEDYDVPRSALRIEIGRALLSGFIPHILTRSSI